MPSRKEKKRRKELLKQYQASHEKGQVSYRRTAGQVPDRRAMEKVAAFFGLILGMGLACLIAKFFVPGSSIWTAAILLLSTLTILERLREITGHWLMGLQPVASARWLRWDISGQLLAIPNIVHR